MSKKKICILLALLFPIPLLHIAKSIIPLRLFAIKCAEFGSMIAWTIAIGYLLYYFIHTVIKEWK